MQVFSESICPFLSHNQRTNKQYQKPKTSQKQQRTKRKNVTFTGRDHVSRPVGRIWEDSSAVIRSLHGGAVIGPTGDVIEMQDTVNPWTALRAAQDASRPG